MGINAEMVSLVAQLRSRRALVGDTVVEIGAQAVCAASEAIAAILEAHGFSDGTAEPTGTAAELYSRLGFAEYAAIDATGENGALMLDLNRPLAEMGFDRQFDLVTNLGTAEHCFDQFAVFKNLHDLCKPGAVMIHALPVQGLVNHGFYNYHPRFIADLVTANEYELIDLAFTVDFTPVLHKYDLATFKSYDFAGSADLCGIAQGGGCAVSAPLRRHVCAPQQARRIYARRGRPARHGL